MNQDRHTIQIRNPKILFKLEHVHSPNIVRLSSFKITRSSLYIHTDITVLSCLKQRQRKIK